jgi:uncharacterized protein (UPF0264 family)
VIRLLASVRDAAEALAAAQAGADLIDLKDPLRGSLGALPLESIGPIVAQLRAGFATLPISATVGDLAPADLPRLPARMTATAACGVTYVKVGVAAGTLGAATLQVLAQVPLPWVPVVLADRGLDAGLIDRIIALRPPVLMLDTGDKRAGSLFECVDLETVRRLVAQVHAQGLMIGLAGSLRASQVPLLAHCAPDIAGFRGALCDGARTGALVAHKVAGLRQQLHRAACAAAAAA